MAITIRSKNLCFTSTSFFVCKSFDCLLPPYRSNFIGLKYLSNIIFGAMDSLEE